MKLDRWITALQAAVLAFLISFSATSAFVTAFALPLDNSQSLWMTCAAASALCALLYRFRHGAAVLLILGALGAWYLYGQKTALQQLLQLIHRVSYVYNSAYRTGYLQLAGGMWNEGRGDWPVCVWGVLIAATAAGSVSRGWPSELPLFLAAAPLAACFVVTDTPPAPWSLMCLLFGFLLLIFTARVRLSNPSQGNRLTFLCAGPMALALAAVMLAVPPEGYVNQSAQVRQQLAQWVRKVPQSLENIELPQSLQNFYTETAEMVNLAIMDAWNRSNSPVMYVQPDVGGTLYLRGQDYDKYNGYSWTPTSGRVEQFFCQGESLGNVSIETVNRLRRTYLPYYPAQQVALEGGKVENPQLSQQYRLARTGLPGDLYTLLEAGSDSDYSPQEQYLALPKKSRERLYQIAQPLVEGANSATRKAERIASFVRDSARYDPQTPRMDQDADDFALWFLEESDRGYCVHFATAAVALLRSVGVEARYVTGYMVWAQSGQRTVITGENAHAWAEYYEPRLSMWLPLEATPSAGQPQRQQQQQLPEPQQTLPAPTQLPEAPQPPAPTQAPTQSQQSGPSEPPRQPDSPSPEEVSPFAQRLADALKTALALALIWAMLSLQRLLRMRLRQYWQRRGTPNAQALARWREVEQLSQLLKHKPPEELKELALKAKFSQYTLTSEELLLFDANLRKARRSLARENPLKRLMYKYIYAVL